MELTQLTPKQSLNKAYLKEKVTRTEIESFKTNLVEFLNNVNEKETEEYSKNLITKFLNDTYYSGKNQINTKGRIDLAIYENSKPVVIIEAKRPGASEMVSAKDLNKKALHELMLYYLLERVDHSNIDIKYLIITDTYQWFIFEASVFNSLFYQNKSLMKDFTDWKTGRKESTDRDLFYNHIAKPFITQLKDEVKFTWFDLKKVAEVAKNKDPKDDKRLIDLFKILSPVHLLKQPFSNDSNSLDTKFYSELLHIIGLEEKKEKGKKIIQRKEKPDAGSLLENAINILESEDRLYRLPKDGADYGATKEERLFNIALELCITWINRILFLKLLEGQLSEYHGGDKSYRFLDFKTIPHYDELNKLFFQVLAQKTNDRKGPAIEKYAKVPYLNSSLFEPNELERETIHINSLDDSLKISLASGTVLKKENGKKRTGELPTLQYLLEFLDAYDFASEGKEEIQEENKSIINASVLGLIFEKINGYKDGSFFTPGFITMYMCRETIRRAVVQKFNEAKGWKNESFEQLYNQIQSDDVKEANNIINSLKICDPAVGSGHFLVSALNELIAIKSELGILTDRDGKVLRDYAVEVINDELIVSINHETFFEYKPGNKESQRVQEALFHEKQTLIENCLFGVDINPNSVKICRLRLWIELLKNAYYTAESKFTELETLPNIDINIKQGNSLISRFPLDADLSKALKSVKYSIDDYRAFVNNYKNATDKEEKRGFEKLIDQIKSDFRTEIGKNDPKVIRKNKLGGELYNLLNQAQVFEPTEKEKQVAEKKKDKLEKEINKLGADIEEIKNSAIYKDAFEWRFEFPEVLDSEGRFIGFDVVIGNPPYIRQEEISNLKDYLQSNYESFSSTADLLVYFVERGLSILNRNKYFTFIVANKFLRASYGESLRKYLSEFQILRIIDFGDLPVFTEATTYPAILSIRNSIAERSFLAIKMNDLNFNNLSQFIDNYSFEVDIKELESASWRLEEPKIIRVFNKINNGSISLEKYVNGQVYYGIKTGLNKAFVIDQGLSDSIINNDSLNRTIVKPFIEGKDVKRYQQLSPTKSIILFPNGATKQLYGEKIDEEKAYSQLSIKYSSIFKHLDKYKTDARNRSDQGDFWWELRPCDYYDKFESPKIIYPNICKRPEFTFDNNGYYANQKCFIIPREDRFLLGVLNSSLSFFFFRMVLPKLRGDFYEPSYTYLKDFPIRHDNDKIVSKINILVSSILDSNSKNSPSNSVDLEKQIDQLVYQLYGLTEEEIRIVEELK